MSVFFLWLLLWDTGLVGWLGWAIVKERISSFIKQTATCVRVKIMETVCVVMLACERNLWLFSSSVKSYGSSKSPAIVESISSLDTQDRFLWTVPIHVSVTSDLKLLLLPSPPPITIIISYLTLLWLWVSWLRVVFISASTPSSGSFLFLFFSRIYTNQL